MNMKIKIAIVLLVIGLIVLAATQLKAATPSGAQPSSGGTNQDSLIITDYDAAYDYMLDKGVWYTRAKGTQTWRDMKTALSAANYTLAISRLNAHIS